MHKMIVKLKLCDKLNEDMSKNHHFLSIRSFQNIVLIVSYQLNTNFRTEVLKVYKHFKDIDYYCFYNMNNFTKPENHYSCFMFLP